uniref:Uncharacterized protein n=1 Tax=Caenorhabditis japonica TaxID=281687 RepID=A0A8R1E5V1_CAEJA
MWLLQSKSEVMNAFEVKNSGCPHSVNTRRTDPWHHQNRIPRNAEFSWNKTSLQLGIARSTVQTIVRHELKLKSYLWPASGPGLNPMNFSI